MSNYQIQKQGMCINHYSFLLTSINVDCKFHYPKCPSKLANIVETLNRKLKLVKQKLKQNLRPWTLSFKFKQNCKLEYFLPLVMLRERFVITNTITRIPSSWNISIMSFTNHIRLAWLGKNKLEFKFILM